MSHPLHKGAADACPFCGGFNLYFGSAGNIICRGCGATGPDFSATEEEATQRWNKRGLTGTNESGAALIAAERLRQIQVEGKTAAGDDQHSAYALPSAAGAYLQAGKLVSFGMLLAAVRPAGCHWPWPLETFKPSPDPLRNYVKAGALLAAEIDRLLRAKAREDA